MKIFTSSDYTNDPINLSLDFIAGLIAGEGSFMWINQNGNQIPVFQLKMHADERPLFELIKAKLALKDKIHEYTHQNRHYVLLIIRKRSTIENIIIPTFDQRLFGLKKKQFDAWRDKFYQRKLLFKYKYS